MTPSPSPAAKAEKKLGFRFYHWPLALVAYWIYERRYNFYMKYVYGRFDSSSELKAERYAENNWANRKLSKLYP